MRQSSSAAFTTSEDAVSPPEFGLFYRTTYEQIRSYLQRMIGNVEDAHDLTVVSFEKAFKNWERAPAGKEIPWLYRIATNTCLDEIRRRRLIRWQPLDTFVRVFSPRQVARDDPERDAVRNEARALVRSALDKLSPRHRAALIMRECQGLSCDEIGEAMGVSRDAAKQLLFRARHQLKEQYLHLGGEPLDG